jgi:hypothetical protein
MAIAHLPSQLAVAGPRTRFKSASRPTLRREPPYDFGSLGDKALELVGQRRFGTFSCSLSTSSSWPANACTNEPARIRARPAPDPATPSRPVRAAGRGGQDLAAPALSTREAPAKIQAVMRETVRAHRRVLPARAFDSSLARPAQPRCQAGASKVSRTDPRPRRPRTLVLAPS